MSSATLVNQMDSLHFLITNPPQYFLAMYTCVYQVVLIQNNALFLCISPKLDWSFNLIRFYNFLWRELRNSPLYSFLIPPLTASLFWVQMPSVLCCFHTPLFFFIPLM
jgi:hypothetical protein